MLILLQREQAMKPALILTISLLISGCSSFGKGVTEAFLEKQDAEDTRACQVYGDSFDGIEPNLTKTGSKTKVLMVHGVGHHVPGYSAEFLEKLAKELNLTVMNRSHKELSLTDPFDTSKQLGTLRVKRLTNEDASKELLYYELSWSAITAPEKSALEYDNSGEYSYRRADINDMLKKFSNDTAPDPMIYFGDKHDAILTSFRQSFCWMVRSDWESLPSKTSEFCNPMVTQTIENLINDNYSVVSHSLGSRITIDALQSYIELFSDDNKTLNDPEMKAKIVSAFKNQTIPLYMLSNQLPMLQMGQRLPEVTDSKAAYCSPAGSHYNERILTKTSIIAFSDPNDLLSYAIPYGYAKEKIDSRFCVDITNININVANVIDLLGLGTLANLLTAHTGYDSDDRVVALIAKGIGNPNTAPLVQERCEWIRLVD
jgi:hypothetical protein